MDDRAKQKRMYHLLALFFGIAGVVWIVSGFFSPRYVLFPMIGLANLGLAYVCRKSGI